MCICGLDEFLWYKLPYYYYYYYFNTLSRYIPEGFQKNKYIYYYIYILLLYILLLIIIIITRQMVYLIC